MITRLSRWTLAAALAAGLCMILAPMELDSEATSAIVQGPDLTRARAAVLAVGGTVTHELGIINAVGAVLTPDQRRTLRAAPDAPRILEDSRVEVAKKKVKITIPDTGYPTRVDAHLLHDQGITGD